VPKQVTADLLVTAALWVLAGGAMRTLRVLCVATILGAVALGLDFTVDARSAAGHGEALISSQVEQATELLARLSSVAGLPVPLPLTFLEEFSIVNGFFVGGCFETLHVGERVVQAYQSPAMFISYGALWADKGSRSPDVTGYILAHELAHYARALSAPDRACERTRRLMMAAQAETTGDRHDQPGEAERQRLIENLKNEEIEADRGAVVLLNKLGFDGASMAERALRVMCERMGCPRESADHPTLEARIDAIHTASVQALLEDITFQLYVKPGTPFVGTAFNLRPSRSHIRKVAATAGHVWRELLKSSAVSPDVHRFCDADDRCIPIKLRQGWTFDDVVAYSEQDPIDFAYFWDRSSGESTTRYPTVAAAPPKIGDTCYSLGADEHDRRGLATLRYLGRNGGYLYFKHIGGPFMRPGTSGSPVVNAAGELIGISVRSSEERGTVRATNIQTIIDLAEQVMTGDAGPDAVQTPY
jgi:hypothetical protein